MSTLRYTHDQGVATITLANPPQNRLSADVMQAFVVAVTDISARTDTRAVLVRAEGPDFSFGGDIAPWPEHTEETAAAMIGQGLPVANTFEDLPVPIVVAVQGHCMGGGFELALRGDIIVASDNAKFGHPEATIGIFTLLGGVQRVAERVGRTRATQWAFTAELVNAAQAQEIGLINEVVPQGELDATANQWIHRLANGPTLAHADHKKLLRAWSNGGIEAADALMPAMAGKALMTEDAQGSIAHAIEALKAGKPRPAYPFKGR